MSIRIQDIERHSDLKRWVRFVYDHYRGHPFKVPQLYFDELSYFDHRRNPNFEVCRAKLWLAFDGDRAVGRICAIFNPLEAEKLGYRRGRFGWFESVDDQRVADRLLGRAREWLAEQGCSEFGGPYGFTDLDPEGLLVDGFDAVPSLSGSYNYPYYPVLLERAGLEKEVDYLEFRCRVPDRSPLFDRMRKRFEDPQDYRVVTCRSRKELIGYAPQLWAVLQEAFAPLHGVVPLTERQTDYYTKKYLAFLDPDFVKLTFDSTGMLVGFFIGIPNLSQSFRRAGGHLLPTGFWHILKEYRNPETVEFLLVAAKPGCPTAQLSGLTFLEMYDSLRRRGVSYMEANRQLEGNTTVNGIWRKFETVNQRRTRIYRGEI